MRRRAGILMLGAAALLLAACDLPYRFAWDKCDEEGFAQDGTHLLKCDGGQWKPGLTVKDADAFLEQAYGIPPTRTPLPHSFDRVLYAVRERSGGVEVYVRVKATPLDKVELALESVLHQRGYDEAVVTVAKSGDRLTIKIDAPSDLLGLINPESSYTYSDLEFLKWFRSLRSNSFVPVSVSNSDDFLYEHEVP